MSVQTNSHLTAKFGHILDQDFVALLNQDLQNNATQKVTPSAIQALNNQTVPYTASLQEFTGKTTSVPKLPDSCLHSFIHYVTNVYPEMPSQNVMSLPTDELAKVSLALGILDLSNTDINDSELEKLIQRNPHLKIIDLSGCKNLTGFGLAPLQRLTKLKSLNLSDCTKMTDAGLRYLKNIPTLETLDLRGCKMITESGLAYVEEISTLTHLELDAAQQQPDTERFSTGELPPNMLKSSIPQGELSVDWDGMDKPIAEEERSSSDEENVYRPGGREDSWINP